jgi:biotin operon repressor
MFMTSAAWFLLVLSAYQMIRNMDAHHMGSRWGTVSASVMRRPGLSVAAKTVYAALSTYADRAGWIWVRQETIASDLERSRAWVHAAIAELEGQGLILHDRQYIEGRQRASRYRLRDGLPREARETVGTVSEKTDAAVQPADTNHHDESKDSLWHSVGESPGEAGQGINGDPPEPCPASLHASASPDGIAPDWVPTAADVAWEKARHPNLDVLAFTETFVLSCRAKGYRYSDPSAAWRRWLIEPKGRLPLLRALSPKAASKQDTDHDDRRPNDRHRGSSRPSRPSSSGLAERNAERAAACLERILGRRAAAASAGPSA